MDIKLKVPKDFNFLRTVYSHGWCSLLPFEVDKDRFNLKRVIELSNRKLVLVEISQRNKQYLNIQINSPDLLNFKKEIIEQMRICFRLNEDFSEFYEEAKRYKEFRWVTRIGAGRLLRAPTVFEDIVKMICTTNCSWELTEIMVGNLCKKLGRELDIVGENRFSFPKPEAIADCSEKFLRKEIRVGYRAPYIIDLSIKISKGELDVESWRTSNAPTKELFKEVCSVKGIGPYAGGNVLKLLGRYDYLGLDSWSRWKFFELRKNGRRVSDKVIEKHYQKYGKWRGLFFWLDVTKHWYKRKIPF